MCKNDEKIMAALLETGTALDAAALAGVGKSTVYNRLQNAEFRREYDRRRNIAIAGAGTALISRLGSAISIVSGIAENAENSPQIRLNACQILLTTALKLHEQIDIKQKMEEIERRLNYAIER